jgi:hypothetical protein
LLANEKDLEKIIKDNQGIFNKIIKSNKLIPKFILKYRKTKKLTPTPEKKEIIDAIKHFKKEGIPINNKSIADFCGFNAYILNHASNKELNTLIDQHRTQDNLIEEKIIETIEKFKKDGKKATITKVAKNVGVLPSVIYNNPDLSKHFEIDRKIDTTYIPRIKSAIEEIKLKKNRLTISEVARRADICRRVIYKYPILKQTIDKAIQDSMHPKYYEAKEKIRNLQESDKIITPEIIAKETNISIELIYANSDLRELIKNNCTNKMDIFKKRLKKAYNSLLKKNKQLTIRNITAEAKMARKTLYKYKELHQYIKILFFSNKKQQLIRAKTHLQRNNQAISIRTLLKKRVLEKVGGIVLKI